MKKFNFKKEKIIPKDISVYVKSSHGDFWVEAFGFLESLK